MVCSDNKTYSTDVKAMGKGDFTCIPHGINGIEDRLGVVWEKIVHSEKTDTTRYFYCHHGHSRGYVINVKSL
jgi:hypothetical protein